MSTSMPGGRGRRGIGVGNGVAALVRRQTLGELGVDFADAL